MAVLNAEGGDLGIHFQLCEIVGISWDESSGSLWKGVTCEMEYY